MVGKTGTAKTGEVPSHSWFKGYASFKSPQLAVCVIVENVGYASVTTLPLATKLIRKAVRLSLLQLSSEK